VKFDLLIRWIRPHSVTRDRMLLVLPDDQKEADWVIDHLVTKIQGKPPVMEKKDIESGSNVDSPRAGKGQHHSHARALFGKLKFQSSRFTRSDTELTADDSDDGIDDVYRSSDQSSHDDEWAEMKNDDWIKLPFELQCVDSILFCVKELHERDTNKLAKDSSGYINFILQQKNLGEDHFKVIRGIKDRRQELASRVKGFCASLTRVLNEGTLVMGVLVS
jgi:hypothetical protein